MLDVQIKKLKQPARDKLNRAKALYASGDYSGSYHYLEQAHILGQRFIKEHTLSHWWMLKVAYRTRDMQEFVGQVPRLLASIVFSKVWVPVGNSGRASVSAIKPMPIPKELENLFYD